METGKIRHDKIKRPNENNKKRWIHWKSDSVRSGVTRETLEMGSWALIYHIDITWTIELLPNKKKTTAKIRCRYWRNNRFVKKQSTKTTVWPNRQCQYQHFRAYIVVFAVVAQLDYENWRLMAFIGVFIPCVTIKIYLFFCTIPCPTNLKGIDTKILEIRIDVDGGGEQIRERKKAE